MALANDAVDASLIVSSITGEGSEWTGDVTEQRRDLRAIIDLAGRQFRREDLPGLSVNTDVQLALGSTCASAVLLDQPLAGPTEPQACAVDQQVNRASGAWRWLWDLQPFGAAA